MPKIVVSNCSVINHDANIVKHFYDFVKSGDIKNVRKSLLYKEIKF